MISWEELVYDLNELNKLENGHGSEIEFEYEGNSYGITLYRDHCDLAYMPSLSDPDTHIEKRYASLDELGHASDFGFRLVDVWDSIDGLICKPDFEDFSLEDILHAYRKALNGRNHPQKRTTNHRP